MGLVEFLVVSWFGILGPPGLPKSIVDSIGKEIAAALEDATLRDRLLNVGATAAYQNASDYARHIALEYPRWARLVKEANIPLQD